MIDRTFFILQKNNLRRLAVIFKKRNWAQILVIIASSLIILGLAVGVYFFSFNIFAYLQQYPESTEPVILYALAVTFVMLAILSFLSGLITSLGLLFQKNDNQLLFSLPIKSATIFENRILEVILISSWPLYVFGWPQILGFSQAFRLDWQTRLVFLGGVFFLGLLFTCLSALISLFLTALGGNFKKKLWLIIALGLVPVLAAGLIKFLLPPVFLTDLGPLEVKEISQLVKNQPLLGSFLPSTWLTNLVSSWSTNFPLALTSLFNLLGTFLIIAIMLILLRGDFYRQAVDRAEKGQFLASPQDKTKTHPRPFPYLLPGRWGVLTEKDWLVIFRSPGQFFELVFILFLQIVYLLIITRIPLARIQRLFPHWDNQQLLTLNSLFTYYLAAVFGMRFFFPMISLEGHSSWVIWSAPIKKTTVFWQKLISSWLILFVWLQTTTLWLSWNSPAKNEILLPLNLLIASGVTIITIGMGTIFPNYEEKNPEKLSTSPGGIVATFLCLVFISLTTYLSSIFGK